MIGTRLIFFLSLYYLVSFIYTINILHPFWALFFIWSAKNSLTEIGFAKPWIVWVSTYMFTLVRVFSRQFISVAYRSNQSIQIMISYEPRGSIFKSAMVMYSFKFNGHSFTWLVTLLLVLVANFTNQVVLYFSIFNLHFSTICGPT